MIGRRKHPREPSRLVFVPLRRGDKKHWVLVLAQGYRESLWEAAAVCADDHPVRMAEIARRARIIRAICEHPELEFCFESMDADTLRDEVRALEELIRIESQNAAHLLDLPDEESEIYDGDVRLGVSEDGLMEPWAAPDELPRPDRGDRSPVRLIEPWILPDEAAEGMLDDEPEQSADELFARFLEACLRAVVEVKGETVSRAGIADAIARLRDVHGNDDDSGDHGNDDDDSGEGGNDDDGEELT